MDPLDRLIQLANLQGRLDQRCQLQGSWALEHPQAVPGEATFHIVMAGTCYCEFLDGGRLDLHPGDLILLPRGTPHLLRSDSPAQPCEPTVEHRGSIPLYQLNGPGEALDMLCGSYRYHAGASLFGALPERLLVHMDESTQQPLRALIGLMREEAESTRSGARSIIDALATALFALAHGVAHGLELPDLSSPWLYALGFVAATAALHAAGYALVRFLPQAAAPLVRLAGLASAGAGVWLLAG